MGLLLVGGMAPASAAERGECTKWRVTENSGIAGLGKGSTMTCIEWAKPSAGSVWRGSNESLLEAINHFPMHAWAWLSTKAGQCPSFGCGQHSHSSGLTIGYVILIGIVASVFSLLDKDDEPREW